MPQASTVLTQPVPEGGHVSVHVPHLRQGDIDEGTGRLSVGGFSQPDGTYEFAVDFAYEDILVTNRGTDPWASGASVVVSWEGIILEDAVLDHEARLAALEAAPPVEGGGGSIAPWYVESGTGHLLVTPDGTHDLGGTGHRPRNVTAQNTVHGTNLTAAANVTAGANITAAADLTARSVTAAAYYTESGVDVLRLTRTEQEALGARIAALEAELAKLKGN